MISHAPAIPAVGIDAAAHPSCNGCMRSIIATAIVMFALASPAWAGFDEGFLAWALGDCTTAVREFRALAEQSDTRAQTYLGLSSTKLLREFITHSFGLTEFGVNTAMPPT